MIQTSDTGQSGTGRKERLPFRSACSYLWSALAAGSCNPKTQADIKLGWEVLSSYYCLLRPSGGSLPFTSLLFARSSNWAQDLLNSTLQTFPLRA